MWSVRSEETHFMHASPCPCAVFISTLSQIGQYSSPLVISQKQVQFETNKKKHTVNPLDGWRSSLQPRVGDCVCPLFLSSLMNEQQKKKASWGFPAHSRPGLGCRGKWGRGGVAVVRGVWVGQPCANISLHVERG